MNSQRSLNKTIDSPAATADVRRQAAARSWETCSEFASPRRSSTPARGCRECSRASRTLLKRVTYGHVMCG